jgi:Regulator of chromosome condensation (RCC1) repeat
MRFTRRLIERRSSQAFVIFTSVLLGAAGASCGSDDTREDRSADAAPDEPTDAAPPIEASAPTPDASGPRDAGAIDAAPPPIVCASASCATSLVTSSSIDEISHNEGFCALMQDRTVVCWGSNWSGQLGRGWIGSEDSAIPERVINVSNIVSLHHTCAVDSDGAAFCWGTGPFLQRGTGFTMERAPVRLPIPAASHVDSTLWNACAVIGEAVHCWGLNDNGQVGPFNTTSRNDFHGPQLVPLTGAAPIRDIAVSRATFVLRADGTLESWGANPPLGRASPLFPDPYAAPISMSGISNVDLMAENACFTAGGHGYCWGAVIPDPSNVLPPSVDLTNALPEAVSTPELIVQIATTMNLVKDDFGTPIAQPQRWCGVGLSGDVYCWGVNASGQAGDGTKDHAYEPVKVVGLPGPAAQVRATPDATCALLTSGKIYCWGSNYYGQLGNGAIRQPSLTPQEVLLP